MTKEELQNAVCQIGAAYSTLMLESDVAIEDKIKINKAFCSVVEKEGNNILQILTKKIQGSENV